MRVLATARRCRWPRLSCPATLHAPWSCMSSPARVPRLLRTRTVVRPAGSGPARSLSPTSRPRQAAPARGSAAADQPSNRHTLIPLRQSAPSPGWIHSHAAGAMHRRYKPELDVLSAAHHAPAQAVDRARVGARRALTRGVQSPYARDSSTLTDSAVPGPVYRHYPAEPVIAHMF